MDLLNCLERVPRVVKFLLSKSASPRRSEGSWPGCGSTEREFEGQENGKGIGEGV